MTVCVTLSAEESIAKSSVTDKWGQHYSIYIYIYIEREIERVRDIYIYI